MRFGLQAEKYIFFHKPWYKNFHKCHRLNLGGENFDECVLRTCNVNVTRIEIIENNKTTSNNTPVLATNLYDDNSLRCHFKNTLKLVSVGVRHIGHSFWIFITSLAQTSHTHRCPQGPNTNSLRASMHTQHSSSMAFGVISLAHSLQSRECQKSFPRPVAALWNLCWMVEVIANQIGFIFHRATAFCGSFLSPVCTLSQTQTCSLNSQSNSQEHVTSTATLWDV